MQFPEAVGSGFRNCVNFRGRAARSEYWYWTLFEILLSIVSGILDVAVFPFASVGPFSAIVTVVLFLPGLAVAARRLHDIDRTAWWLLLFFTVIGAILLFVWAFFKGTRGPNRYGTDPL